MKMKLVILSGLIAAMFVACDDSSSSSTNSSDAGAYSSASGTNAGAVPDTVATLDELQKYTCSAAYKCAHVYLVEWSNVMECDGKAWAYLSEYTPSVCGYGSSSSAAVESSSSAVAGVSSSSEEPVTASSSSAAEIASSSSAVESSSSPVTDQCSAMDKNDITTWHFVRDTFGGSVTYTYSVDADGKIIVTTKASDGTEKIAQTYPGSSAAYMEMVYNAALSTCRGE